jgi:hypothetical protein
MSEESVSTTKITLSPKFKALVSSRKFWAAVVGLAFVIAKAYYGSNLPLSEDNVTNIVYLLMAYIVGTALDNPTSSTTNVGSDAVSALVSVVNSVLASSSTAVSETYSNVSADTNSATSTKETVE